MLMEWGFFFLGSCSDFGRGAAGGYLVLEVVDIVEGVMKDQLPKSILHIGTYSNIYDSYHNYLFRPKGKG
jgi:hypothetical protein